MTIQFRDVYTALRQMKQMAELAKLDTEKIFNDEAKATVTNEAAALSESYFSLYNSDIRLVIDIDTIRAQVADCMPDINVH
jgi:hypothetical protein